MYIENKKISPYHSPRSPYLPWLVGGIVFLVGLLFLQSWMNKELEAEIEKYKKSHTAYGTPMASPPARAAAAPQDPEAQDAEVNSTSKQPEGASITESNPNSYWNQYRNRPDVVYKTSPRSTEGKMGLGDNIVGGKVRTYGPNRFREFDADYNVLMNRNPEFHGIEREMTSAYRRLFLGTSPDQRHTLMMEQRRWERERREVYESNPDLEIALTDTVSKIRERTQTLEQAIESSGRKR